MQIYVHIAKDNHLRGKLYRPAVREPSTRYKYNAKQNYAENKHAS